MSRSTYALLVRNGNADIEALLPEDDCFLHEGRACLVLGFGFVDDYVPTASQRTPRAAAFYNVPEALALTKAFRHKQRYSSLEHVALELANLKAKVSQ
jgi:hypothetical protein